MYIIPGYVDYYEEDDAIYVTSRLYQNTVKLSDPAIMDEFRSVVRCGGCPEISSPLSNFLHDQELLVNDLEIDAAIQELRNLMEQTLQLTIMPTEGCNFRCPYCYEDHAPVSMSRQTLDHIHQYIIEQAPHCRHININWFGGEPTLCKDVILETAELVQSLQRTYDIPYNSSMTTNGYLLSIQDFQLYYQAGITTYQITLDGWNHDQTRPHVSGKGTLQVILDNLIAISALPADSYQYHITLRHNILPGDEDYSWYDYLNDLFGKDSRFSILVRAVSDWGGESVQSMKLLQGKELDELIGKHVDYIKKIHMNCDNTLWRPLSHVCYASYPHGLVFRANGKIEKCTICLDHPKNLAGMVDPERGIVLNEEINRLWSSFHLKPECHSCTKILSCLNMSCKLPKVIRGIDSGCTCTLN